MARPDLRIQPDQSVDEFIDLVEAMQERMDVMTLHRVRRKIEELMSTPDHFQVITYVPMLGQKRIGLRVGVRISSTFRKLLEGAPFA